MPKSAPFEAMAAEPTPRGYPYRYFDIDFPPGVWVDISAEQAEKLKASTDAVTVRTKGSG